MRRPLTLNDKPVIDGAHPDRVGSLAWFHKYPRGWPLALFLLAAAGTIASVISIERADHLTRAAELDRNAIEIAAGLQRRAAENIALLRAGAALFGASDSVNSSEFAEFSYSLYGQNDYYGGRGMGWAPLLRGADAARFETSMRRKSPEYRIHPAPPADQPHIAPVVYLTQNTRTNPAAFGFEMYSDPIRVAAMSKALRLRQPVATGIIKLVPRPGHPPEQGFMIYMPVLRLHDGHQVATGLVYTPFRADEFLNSAAELFRNRDVELSIYDGVRDPAHLLAQHRVPGTEGVSLERTITIAGRPWLLHVSAKLPQALSTLSQATLFFGFVIAVMVTYTARLITKRASEDRQVLELLARQAAIRTSLTRELNHRVKNTLANVLSIVSLTRRRATDLDSFAEGLTARLRALSATHDLLSHSDWTTAPIDEIVYSELAPYMPLDASHVDMAGPALSLAPNDALSLGLALHELATNAAKYGALSTPEGRVRVTWVLLNEKLAEVRWRESGGPPVVTPAGRGFGRDLIEKIVAHELRSPVELEFHTEGVQCRLQVPVRRTAEFSLRHRRSPA